MPTPNAVLAGTFAIGDALTVNRLGFGAMRITGSGIWGAPADRDEVLRVLRRLPDLGIDFIDTAESYGPLVSENLIREALHPYDGLTIATKAGFQRPGPDAWRVDCRPEMLRQGLEGSLQRLGVERIDLWQLHRIDSKVPRDEQFDAVRGFIEAGLIRHAGLSEVSVEEIEAAQQYFPVATVQNRFNVTDRASAEVLAYCEAHGIGFIPWAPLGSGRLVRQGSVLEEIAERHLATPGQVAIAWMLRCSPVMLPIPGTSKLAHLEENVAATALQLSDEDFATLDGLGKA